jgi:serine/threonine protein kinase
MIPWTISHQDAQNIPGKRIAKRSAHGALIATDDGKMLKVIKRDPSGEIPYEFVMEIVSRDRCDDLDPAISRLAPITGVVECPEAYIIEMPNVGAGNGDLGDLIMGNKTKNVDMTRIAGDIVRAVHTMHSRGVAHRDIKDSNILVESDPDGTLRGFLCDMSLATCSPHIIGDPFLPYTGRYRSPEIVRYDKKGGNFGLDWLKCDIYALGALLGRMAASKIFGYGVGMHPPTLKEVRHDIPTFQGKDIVMMMMHRIPAKRPTTLEILDAMHMSGDIVMRKPREMTIHADADDAIRRHISDLSDAKGLPGMMGDVARDIFSSLPEVDRTERNMYMCIAFSAKMGASMSERCILRVPQELYSVDLKRLSGFILRNRENRDTLHRMLRIHENIA